MSRLAIRNGRIPVFAGHGYVDPSYRPPRLPYVSVVGPLSFSVEPDRDPTIPKRIFIQRPGYLAGSALGAADVVPANGALRLRFDGDPTVALALNFADIAGDAFDDPATGPDVAGRLQAAIRDAAAADAFEAPLSAQAMADSAGITVRWDATASRIAMASGARGVVAAPRVSTVEVLDGALGIAGALGLVTPSLVVAGRVHRRTLPAAKALGVDVRIDLWGGLQSSIAAMVDRLARAVPTRSQFVTRPALLAVDVADGETEIRLMPVGEPTRRSSLVHAERVDAFVERVADRVFETVPPAVAAQPQIRLETTEIARVAVHPMPPIPDPIAFEHPAPRGFALTLGLVIDGAMADGQAFRFARLEHTDPDDAVTRTALQIEAEGVQINGDFFVDFTATATFRPQAGDEVASTRWRVASTRFDSASFALHVVAHSQTGEVEIYLDGQAAIAPTNGEELDVTAATPVIVAGGSDMVLTLGNPDGGGNPLPIEFDVVHLHAEPMGPLDPALRASPTPAPSMVPGAPLGLAFSEDGYSAADEAFTAIVLSVDGDVVTVDRPIETSWPRGRTLVFEQVYFFQQKALRRKDDLINHLFRFNADYRVSALLEPEHLTTTAPLAEEQVTEVTATGRAHRPHKRTPGVYPRLTSESS